MVAIVLAVSTPDCESGRMGSNPIGRPGPVVYVKNAATKRSAGHDGQRGIDFLVGRAILEA
jgi:hypothetical protein